MVKLKRFNENKDSDDDIISYVRYCFVDFLENYKTNITKGYYMPEFQYSEVVSI